MVSIPSLYPPPGIYNYILDLWHAPSSRHLRALLSVCGGGSFGGLECCSGRVCVCVSVSGVLFSVGVCVCVCDLLIFLPSEKRFAP